MSLPAAELLRAVIRRVSRERDDAIAQRDTALAERDRARALAVQLEQRLAWRLPAWLHNPSDVDERMSAIGMILVDDIHPEAQA